VSTPAPAPAEGPAPDALAAEDKKLVTLARSTRARTRAAPGAAARDADGRPHAAPTVDLPSLQVSAPGGCVAMAVAAGATGPGAAVVLTDAAAVTPRDRDALRDLGGSGVPVHRGDAKGALAGTTLT